MSYETRPGSGLGYTAPGPRNAAESLAPPPPRSFTPTAPGSNFMSYGAGLRDRSPFMFNSLPYGAIEGQEPQSSYDVGSQGLALPPKVVQGSAAGAGTPPPQVDVRVTQAPSVLPQLLFVAVAAFFAYREVKARDIEIF